MTKKQEDLTFAAAGIAVIIALTMFSAAAGATYKPPKDPSQEQHQGQDQLQDQDQHQGQDQQLHNAVDVAASSEAINEGNSLSVESNYESGPANLVLIPHSNTEPCIRVFGFAFGNDEASGMFGIPWRSKQCDYKGFAADADAQGALDLGWFWRCHMKTAYKTFKGKGESTEAAIEQCITRMSKSSVIDLQRRLKAADEQILFLKSHEKVCEDSLSRCEEKAYGGK